MKIKTKKTKIQKMKATYKLYMVYSLLVMLVTAIFVLYNLFVVHSESFVVNDLFTIGFTVFNIMFGFATFSYTIYVNEKHEQKIFDEPETETPKQT